MSAEMITRGGSVRRCGVSGCEASASGCAASARGCGEFTFGGGLYIEQAEVLFFSGRISLGLFLGGVAFVDGVDVFADRAVAEGGPDAGDSIVHSALHEGQRAGDNTHHALFGAVQGIGQGGSAGDGWIQRAADGVGGIADLLRVIEDSGEAGHKGADTEAFD